MAGYPAAKRKTQKASGDPAGGFIIATFIQ